MSIIFNDNILNRSPKDQNDKTGVLESGLWRPYLTISEALANPKLFYRNRGLTIYVEKNGVLTEYWWRDGITDNDLIEKTLSTGDIRTSLIYSSTIDFVDNFTILAIELIDCDLSFFVAHRGVGTSLKGTDSPPTDNTVQVDNITGQVTFKYQFTTFQEDIWFEYKVKASAIPPITPSNFPYPFPSPFN